MTISSLDNEERSEFTADITQMAEAASSNQPTTEDIAARTEANTKSTEQTLVTDPASGKGSLVNDMA